MATATQTPLSILGVELFLPGVRRDSLGRTKEWEDWELNEMASSYNSVVRDVHDAPVLIGHDGKTLEQDQGLPANSYASPEMTPQGEASYAWLERAYVENGKLKGDYRKVNPSFAQALENETYKKRSISIYPRNHPDNPTPGKLNIRHVAYVAIPAVKGMKDHAFGEGNFFEFEFAEFYGSAWSAIARLMQGLRDRMIEDADLETANATFPTELLDAIQRQANDSNDYVTVSQFVDALNSVDALRAQVSQLSMLMQGSDLAYSESTMNLKKMMADKGVTAVKGIAPMDLQAIIKGDKTATSEQMQMIADALGVSVDELKPKTTNMSEPEDYQQLKAQVAALATENKQLRDDRERDRVTNFVEKLVQERKVLPANKAEVIELAISLPNDKTLNYSEGTGSVEATPRDRYLSQLQKGKELWSNSQMPTNPSDAPNNFSETAKLEGFDAESTKTDQLIKQRMKDQGCDYAEAVNQLISTGEIR
jgi:hypothetical protein